MYNYTHNCVCTICYTQYIVHNSERERNRKSNTNTLTRSIFLIERVFSRKLHRIKSFMNGGLVDVMAIILAYFVRAVRHLVRQQNALIHERMCLQQLSKLHSGCDAFECSSSFLKQRNHRLNIHILQSNLSLCIFSRRHQV